MNKGSFAKLFHHKSTAEWRTFGLPKTEGQPEQWDKIYYKTYPRFESVELPKPLKLQTPLENILNLRKTTRFFDPNISISLEQLSTILVKSAGLKSTKPEYSKRYYPSAGALYPLELYVVVARVEGISPGVYHFNVQNSSLELLLQKEGVQDFRNLLGYKWSKDFAVALVTTSVWERNFIKYRDFGYRLICLEAGHLSQNIQLVSEAIGLTYASIAGFKEENLDSLLDLDPDLESSLYLTVLGKAQIN